MEHTKTYMEYKRKMNDKFVRYDEGAEMYHMSLSKFMQLAKDAKACYKVGQCKVNSFVKTLFLKN